jgi:hypothetical protein
MHGLLIAALLAGVIYFPLRIVADAEQRAREHHGTVTVDFCGYRGRANDTADCLGTFRSDDGALIVEGVRFSFYGAHQDKRQHETARASLAGPEDATAELDESVWVGQSVMWVLASVLFGWLVAQVIWFIRALGRHRRASP